VHDAHGRLGLVDVLAAGAAGAHGVDAQVVGPDVDVDLLGLGQHRHRSRPRCARGPWLSVSGTRCTRWPAALEAQVAPGARALHGEDELLEAADLGGLPESISTRQPRSSKKRWYMRNRSPANSAASSPPVPARISMMTLSRSRLGVRDERVLDLAVETRGLQRQPLQLLARELAQLLLALPSTSSACASAGALAKSS
jgi:hypothetical protein